MKRYLLHAFKPVLALSGALVGLLFLALTGIYLTVPPSEKPILDHDRKLLTVQEIIFPGLMAIMNNASWKKEIFSSPDIVALAQGRRQRMKESSACAPQPTCIVELWAITQHEREIFGSILRKFLLNTQEAPHYDEAQWNRDADAINYILAVYGEGHTPHYPKIDAASVDVSAKDFSDFITGIQEQTLNSALTDDREIDPFFKDVMEYASRLLDANDRLDAIRFQDLWSNWNAPSLRFARRLKWKNYPYTAIIVPGEGPEDARTQLSALGKFRLMLAVENFNKGLAPFIIVSGGAVHPAHTDFVEAEEMRRFLTERFNIPERNIVTEPYARHTTTNLRNASRDLQTLRAPDDRPALIVTDQSQSDYISSPVFFKRNMTELKCEPGTIGQRLSSFSTVFVPIKECNRIDPWDPLDP